MKNPFKPDTKINVEGKASKKGADRFLQLAAYAFILVALGTVMQPLLANARLRWTFSVDYESKPMNQAGLMLPCSPPGKGQDGNGKDSKEKCVLGVVKHENE